MSFYSVLPPALQPRSRSRSMGLKLILVCGLALLMSIPALFVFAVVEDRSNREGEVTREISSDVGGQQTFLGPTLAIPYNVPPKKNTDSGWRTRNASVRWQLTHSGDTAP